MLASVTVNAGQVVRPVDTQLLGVNLGVVGLEPEHRPDAADGPGRRPDHVPLPRRVDSDDFHFNAPPTYNGEGTDASMASFIASVGGKGLVTLDYGSGSPQEAAAFLAYLERPGRQHHGDRHGPGVERLGQHLADGQLEDGRLLGRPPRRGAAGARTTASTSSASATPPRSASTTSRSATRNTGAGRSTTTARRPARPGHLRRLRQAVRRPTPRRSTRDLDRPRRRQPRRLQQLDGQHPPAVGRAGVHARLPQRPQLRAGARAARATRTCCSTPSRPAATPGPGQPVRLGRARRPTIESLLTQYLGAAGEQRRAAGDRVQLGLLQPGQADDQPGQRPVRGRLAGRPARDRPTTAPTSGTCATARRPATTTRRASTAGARGATTACSAAPSGSAPSTGTYVPYPTYFAEQLASKIIQAGGEVVQASQQRPEPDASTPCSSRTAPRPAGHQQERRRRPDRPVPVRQLPARRARPRSGSTARPRTPPRARPPTATPPWPTSPRRSTVSGSSFSYSLPGLLDDRPRPGQGRRPRRHPGPTITQAAPPRRARSPARRPSLAVSGDRPGGASSLTYTWATIGTPPAPVSFSANGTNAAAQRPSPPSRRPALHLPGHRRPTRAA